MADQDEEKVEIPSLDDDEGDVSHATYVNPNADALLKPGEKIAKVEEHAPASPDPDPQPEPEPVASDGDPDPSTDHEPDPEPEINEAQRRINQLVAEKNKEKKEKLELAAKISEYEQQIAAFQAANPDAEKKELTPEDIQILAKQYAEAEKYNDQCNAVAAAAAQTYSDFNNVWNAACESVGNVPHHVIKDILEVGDKAVQHKILYELAKDHDKFEQFSNMSPTRRVAEITRMSDKLTAPAAPKPLSKAPNPPKPVSATTTQKPFSPNDTQLSEDEWNKRMDDRDRKKYESRYG